MIPTFPRPQREEPQVEQREQNLAVISIELFELLLLRKRFAYLNCDHVAKGEQLDPQFRYLYFPKKNRNRNSIEDNNNFTTRETNQLLIVRVKLDLTNIVSKPSCKIEFTAKGNEKSARIGREGLATEFLPRGRRICVTEHESMWQCYFVTPKERINGTVTSNRNDDDDDDDDNEVNARRTKSKNGNRTIPPPANSAGGKSSH
ncbi:hypothetical protein K0M31_014013 [Melipona bicolor]|uniref:Uncharacterized protein n=1 Tax=Melipona bicolor TaxID=60889 RepID=A0AA40KU02_9HYME|nr:hypothetical protein K0M31_014013 [Melipona bicolor]